MLVKHAQDPGSDLCRRLCLDLGTGEPQAIDPLEPVDAFVSGDSLVLILIPLPH